MHAKGKTAQDGGALNEWILESAALDEGETVAPEVSRGTAELTVWDECPYTAGRHVGEDQELDEVTISEQLVDAGVEEADREKRQAARFDEEEQ